MRLAISNIAWDIDEDEAVAKLLHRYHVDAIDVAPGKYFREPAKARDKDIVCIKNWWAEQGIEITGMQSLLFGTSGLSIFGSSEVEDATLQHLTAVCRFGAGLGAKRLVFGSPKNRDRTGLSDQQAMDLAVSFFQRLGNVAKKCGVVICLEPNPSCYGANFMINSAETAQVVRQIAHPAIRMQLDTGALAINEEDPGAVLKDSASLIGHIHASEPNLLPLGDGGADHAKVVVALVEHLPNHLVSIEMLATKNEPHQQSIERALNVAIRHYRNSEVGASA